MEKEDPIEEARRYVANAQEIIKKAQYDSETKSYLDSKYVKTAGDVLWKGCLIALTSCSIALASIRMTRMRSKY